MPRAQLIRLRSGTAAEWASSNPVLRRGEPGVEYNTGVAKYGDGVTAWASLPSGAAAVEDIAFGATEMFSAAAMATTSSWPRLLFPTAVTTTAFAGGFNVPAWYGAFDLHIAWSNEGAGAGNVVFAWNLRQVNVGQTPAAGTLIGTGFGAFAAPAANATTVTVLQTPITPVAAPLGFVAGLEIARVGGGADTLANSIGLAAAGFLRLTP